MYKRLKDLRSSLGLSQDAFARRIGLKGSFISLLESGQRNITHHVLCSICREFNVREEWLRDGTGEMYEGLAKTGIAANIIESALESKNDFIMNTFITLAQLTPAEWDFFEKIVDRIKDLDKEPLV